MDSNLLCQFLSTLPTNEIIDKFKQVLENVRCTYSSSSNSEKHLVLAAVAGTITRAQLDRIGVKVTGLQYQKSLRKNNRAAARSIDITTLFPSGPSPQLATQISPSVDNQPIENNCQVTSDGSDKPKQHLSQS